MILHFKQTTFLQFPNGDYVDERQCVEYPRIRHRQQSKCRTVGTAFTVDGVNTSVGTLHEAFDVLRKNLEPGEILAVPLMTGSNHA